MPDENRYNFMPTAAPRVKPQVVIKADYYGDGGVFNPLDGGRGPESDFLPKLRAQWPAPTIPEGGTPVSFLRDDDYPMDPNAGMPKNTFAVDEEPSALAERVDEQMRPAQLVQAEQLALPFKPGEGRRYVQRSDQPLDPSVVSMEMVGVRNMKNAFFDTSFIRKRPNRPAGLVGLGLETSDVAATAATALTATPTATALTATPAASPPLLTALGAIALAPITNTVNGLRAREQSLQNMNAAVFEATVTPYATLRADIDRYYSEMVADPAKVTTLSVPFAGAASTYKLILDTAIKRLQELAKAAKPKKPASVAVETIKALPTAVVQTVKTPYGVTVLAVGAAVVAGLFVIRAMTKK